jgi:hypothetical protein
MSILDSILGKLGLEKVAPAQTSASTLTQTSSPTSVPTTNVPPERKDIPMVDVVSKLDRMQAAFHNKELTWKVSISDLLYVLGMDNSGKGLQSLAEELNCPADLMGDSAKRNMWLHTTVLKKLAENGGNIPPELLKK